MSSLNDQSVTKWAKGSVYTWGRRTTSCVRWQPPWPMWRPEVMVPDHSFGSTMDTHSQRHGSSQEHVKCYDRQMSRTRTILVTVLESVPLRQQLRWESPIQQFKHSAGGIVRHSLDIFGHLVII